MRSFGALLLTMHILRQAVAPSPRAAFEISVVSRIFRTFGLAERHPAPAHAVMAPLIC
jgi:hypothetical protein